MGNVITAPKEEQVITVYTCDVVDPVIRTASTQIGKASAVDFKFESFDGSGQVDVESVTIIVEQFNTPDTVAVIKPVRR
ncbi:hypothetical protein [uncultured Tateyamaria sp.]|uniref:hypothetical protein n=1 Tax=uncultured Tateyamaria sp. TaxID=455651 RepID=UPI0026311971|nr:hypothetical protein [uncultured Tateyamaria sp.]